MNISIVVPAFNEEKLLGGTLAEIKAAAGAFRDQGWACDVVVCDNNSTDRTAVIAREAGAIVVFEPVNQIARARNTGAAAATGDWLVFVDADSHPSRELFADVADEIRRGRCLAGGATMRMDEPLFIAGWLTRFWNWTSRFQKLMAGSFIFVEAAAFRGLGGFSRELFIGEELELSRRLKHLARKNRRTVVILHRHPLMTSARKLKLYSQWEIAGFILRALFRSRKIMRNRDAAFIWYDGRR